jgi:hypothetical protein
LPRSGIVCLHPKSGDQRRKGEKVQRVVWPSGPDGHAEPARYDVVIEHRSHSSTKQADGSYIIPGIPSGHSTLLSTAWSGVQYVGQGETAFNVSDADASIARSWRPAKGGVYVDLGDPPRSGSPTTNESSSAGY